MSMRFLGYLWIGLTWGCTDPYNLRNALGSKTENESALSMTGGSTQDYWVGGWNPGFRKRLAATHIPQSPLFFEACPDAPNGSCLNLGGAGGFYTLAHDQNEQHAIDQNNCKINSGAPYSPRAIGAPGEPSSNPNAPCPYYFYWGVNAQKSPDNGRNFARLIIDTSQFQNAATRNNYLGLQENFGRKGARYFLGLDPKRADHAPSALHVHERKFKFRARFCRLSHADDPYFTARFVHYISISRFDAEGRSIGHKSIAINLQSIAIAPPGTPTSAQHFVGDPAVMNEGVFSSSLGATQPDFNTWHFDGRLHFGMKQPPVLYDDANRCGTDLSTQPWTEVTIPLAAIIQNLQQRGLMQASELTGAVTISGIVAGIETWGRGYVQMDIMDDQVIMKRKPTQTVPAVTSASCYCDFNTSILREAPSPGPAVWKKIVACARPGIMAAAAPLEGSSCRTLNRLGVYQGSTYLCVPSGSASPDPKTLAGYYQGPAGKFYSNGRDAFCYFLGPVPDGSPLLTSPQDPNVLGLRNDGRCPFDS